MSLPQKHFPQQLFEIGVVLLLLGVLTHLVSRTAADPDLWGHIQFGKDILRSGEVTRVDPYSYLTKNQIWINHEWLSEVTFAKVFEKAGSPGLIALKTFLILLIGIGAYFYFRRLKIVPLRSVLIVLLMFMPIFVWTQTIRPQLFTYLFFFFLVAAMHQYEIRRRTILWIVPFLFALWPNFHGGFLAGIALFYLWVAATLLEKRIRRGSWTWLKAVNDRSFLFAAVASLPATLLTPFGRDLWVFLLKTATGERPDIIEWRSLELLTTDGAIYVVMVAVALSLIFFLRVRWSWTRFLVLGVLAMVPWLAHRHLPLFAIAWALLLSDAFADFFATQFAVPATSSRELCVVGILWLGIGLSFVLTAKPHFQCISYGEGQGIPFPKAAVQSMKSAGLQGNVAVFFDWGEFVLFHLSPEIKVSMDGRRETVYPEEPYRESLRLLSEEPGGERLLENPATNFALFPRESAATRKIELLSDWRIGYQDRLSTVFLRKSYSGKPLAPGDAANNQTGCFP